MVASLNRSRKLYKRNAKKNYFCILYFESSTLFWLFYGFLSAMPQFAKLFFEPFSNRLLVYGQHQFGVIARILFYFENIILDIKLPSVFFRINPAIASDSLFLCQKAFYHFLGEADGSAQLFHSQHLPKHRKPLESLFKQGIQP